MSNVCNKYIIFYAQCLYELNSHIHITILCPENLFDVLVFGDC